MYGIYAQKTLVMTLHDSHFCKMWSHIPISLIGVNFSLFLSIRLLVSGFLHGPYNVSGTSMSWTLREFLTINSQGRDASAARGDEMSPVYFGPCSQWRHSLHLKAFLSTKRTFPKKDFLIFTKLRLSWSAECLQGCSSVLSKNTNPDPALIILEGCVDNLSPGFCCLCCFEFEPLHCSSNGVPMFNLPLIWIMIMSCYWLAFLVQCCKHWVGFIKCSSYGSQN